MQKNLNLKVKYRLSFRPFAPSIRSEDLHQIGLRLMLIVLICCLIANINKKK